MEQCHAGARIALAITLHELAALSVSCANSLNPRRRRFAETAIHPSLQPNQKSTAASCKEAFIARPPLAAREQVPLSANPAFGKCTNELSPSYKRSKHTLAHELRDVIP